MGKRWRWRFATKMGLCNGDGVLRRRFVGDQFRGLKRDADFHWEFDWGRRKNEEGRRDLVEEQKLNDIVFSFFVCFYFNF
jgi:hypothetical protein